MLIWQELTALAIKKKMAENPFKEWLI